MRSTLIIAGLLAGVAFTPAFGQSNPPANADRPAATAPAPSTNATMTAPRAQGDMWRASKLQGLDIYNDKNEKIGDINEILLDKSGKIAGVVIGVGGFLGMGEHDVMVEFGKLQFVNEPVRTSSTSTTTPTTGAANRPATTTTSANNNDRKWYPDHAVMAGATKESLKSMPQFKY